MIDSDGNGWPLAFIAIAYLWQSLNILINNVLSSSPSKLSANAFQDSISPNRIYGGSSEYELFCIWIQQLLIPLLQAEHISSLLFLYFFSVPELL
jgi:hypothetical protein